MNDSAPDDSRHWEELQELFARFEQTPKAERAAAMQAAGVAPELSRRVLDLLSAADGMDAAPPAKALPSAFIGPYRLIREIGAGGIGAVYLAEKVADGVTLRAAVKVLAPHAVDKSFVERFYRERQHLAALDHPNITRMLDAGWGDNGQPYLVMEYVEGTHIDEYCDARNLGITGRLRMFLQICDAVSYAHRNLIVHLDLKPSNVLITDSGSVKLLDFGTSKLIRLDDAPTSTIVSTPAYSSPEQMLNEPVSTASDVYGLGAILFALLAGRAPYGKTSATARIEAAVREVEPESIVRAATKVAATHRGMSESKLHHALRGDLSAIVAGCLRSRPRARYSSVEALRDEIDRYLSFQPVRIRGHAVAYTIGKFIRRNRVAIAVSCTVALTVAISMGYAWMQQEHALHEAERSVRMQTFMFSLFKMANPDHTGKPVATIPEFLRAAMTKLPDYVHEPADLRNAQLGLAESMLESGDLADARSAFAAIIASATAANATADRAEAEAFAGSVEFQQGNIAAGRVLEADALKLSRGPDIPPRTRVLAEIYFAYNEDNYGFTTGENLRLLRAAIEESRAHHLVRETSLGLFSLGSVLYMRGLPLEAKPIFQQLLPIYDADPLSRCDRAEVYSWLAWINSTTGDIAGSLPLFSKAYEGYSVCSGADSPEAIDQLPYWADGLIRLGRAPEAVSMLERALPAWRRVAGGSTDRAALLYFLARGYVAVGRFADAEQAATEYLGRVDGKLPPTHRMVGVGHLVLGESLAAQGRYREALPHATLAVDLLVKSAVSTYSRALGAEAVQLAQKVNEALKEP